MKALTPKTLALLLGCLLPSLSSAATINQWTSGACSPAIIAKGNVDVQCEVIVNMYRSVDYQNLQKEIDRAMERVKQYPDDHDFPRELKEARQRLEDFKRDVQKLDESFNTLKINTQRLQLAKHYFIEGKYRYARQTLGEDDVRADQRILLNEKQRNKARQQNNTDGLENNAIEWVVKAQLTAIDYSLKEQRIPKTKFYFEAALVSARKAEHLFSYGYFLQKNNQFKDAESIYREALGSYRQLAQDNSMVHRADVAMTLNNMGALVQADSQRRAEAEKLYREALDIRRQLAQDNPTVYLPDVADTLGKLGMLSFRQNQAKPALACFEEAARILAPFAEKVSELFGKKQAAFLKVIEILRQYNSQPSFKNTL